MSIANLKDLAKRREIAGKFPLSLSQSPRSLDSARGRALALPGISRAPLLGHGTWQSPVQRSSGLRLHREGSRHRFPQSAQRSSGDGFDETELPRFSGPSAALVSGVVSDLANT